MDEVTQAEQLKRSAAVGEVAVEIGFHAVGNIAAHKGEHGLNQKNEACWDGHVPESAEQGLHAIEKFGHSKVFPNIHLEGEDLGTSCFFCFQQQSQNPPSANRNAWQ